MKKKATCSHCGSHDFKNKITTYPVKISGKQINCGRVAVKECLGCQSLTPTPSGVEKINRLLGVLIHSDML